MSWYDLFSNVYDAALETQSAEQPRIATEALQRTTGAIVLDVPRGAGQSFGLLAAGLAGDGRVVGVDMSAGMLHRARARIARERPSQVSVVQADAARLELAAIGGSVPTRLQVFPGLSLLPIPSARSPRCGRRVIVDVYAEHPGLQGRMVEHLANADLRRKFWEALARAGAEYSLTDLPFRWQHRGHIKPATARKAAPTS